MIELCLEIRGHPGDARLLADSIKSQPFEDREHNINLSWSGPNLVPGMTETTFELLATLGVLSFPISVTASIVANLITERLRKATIKNTSDVGKLQKQPAALASLTIIDIERGQILKLDIPISEQKNQEQALDSSNKNDEL